MDGFDNQRFDLKQDTYLKCNKDEDFHRYSVRGEEREKESHSKRKREEVMVFCQGSELWYSVRNLSKVTQKVNTKW